VSSATIVSRASAIVKICFEVSDEGEVVDVLDGDMLPGSRTNLSYLWVGWSSESAGSNTNECKKCVCVCVCVREGERERRRKKDVLALLRSNIKERQRVNIHTQQAGNSACHSRSDARALATLWEIDFRYQTSTCRNEVVLHHDVSV